jgi:hypothetical protein
MFCDGFKFNSVQFNDYEKLMCDLCVTGKIHNAFFHPVARPVLHPALRPVLHPLHSSTHPTLKTWAVGGCYIDGLCWANQRHGFCSPSWPPTTELLTSQIKQLC